VYETLPGWDEPIDSVEDFVDLPTAARDYVEFVERELEVDVTLVGTGAERERVLARTGAAAAPTA
jgi:adenylosuccinate synthase